MPLIYSPKGRAREYSPKALNIYLACTHGCKYCYAPNIRHQNREQYYESPWPRKNIVEDLEKELQSRPQREQVLLSFIGDVYCEAKDDNRATRNCLKLLKKYKVPTAILTKGGFRCLKDIELFSEFGEHIQVGTTLTFDNDKDSKEWESGAALPEERLETMLELHTAGIRTFASMEPVIDPAQSLRLIERGIDCGIDVFKIGKINNFQGLDKKIDWSSFLGSAVEILRSAKKDFYVKEDLRKCASDIPLYGNEIVADAHCVK